MRRVAQFIGSFNQGGSERQAVALSSRLREAGDLDVQIVTLDASGPLAADVEQAGFGEVREFRLTSFYNADFVRQVRACADDLKARHIDIVHTHDFYTNVFGMAAATLAGVKCRIASKRETGGMRSRAQDLVEKLAFGRADAVVVNSGAVRDHLAARGVSAKRLRLIYNGLDLSRFTASGGAAFIRRSGLPEDAPLITLVANLRHSVKNVPMLLRAASDVGGAHFAIAGEGGLEAELRATARDLGVADRVHFLGRCTAVPALLDASFACVLTSTNEGFSNSILEYMAAGRPVVATDAGGAREAVIDGETGYLIASNDHAALADRLNKLLLDPSAASKMGEKGRSVVAERFSVEAQLAETTALYNSLLDR